MASQSSAAVLRGHSDSAPGTQYPTPWPPRGHPRGLRRQASVSFDFLVWLKLNLHRRAAIAATGPAQV